jgi:hypothetical protein
MDTEYHTARNRRCRAGCGAILTFMSQRLDTKCVLAAAVALAALLLPVAALAASSSGVAKARMASSVLQSRQLWATINICNPKDQPDYVGIRGSMPGDRRAHDSMYMSFRVQYLNSTTKHWTDLAGTMAPTFIGVGSGSAARQGGESFQVMPVSGKPAFVFRGLVEFQWRRGKKVLESTKRATTAGRPSPAHADPPGFSAATCLIG